MKSALVVLATAAVVASGASCSYNSTCSVGGITGVCVSISSGCCGNGTATAGLCPGSADVKCCTSKSCTTPQGTGVCKQTAACTGTSTSVAGYCTGPSDLRCCVPAATTTPPPTTTTTRATTTAVPSCTLGTVTGCSTQTVVAGLTNQIIAELNSMGYSFRSLSTARASCSGTCALQTSAANALEAATLSVGKVIAINSAFRSCAQQYLLYNWYLNGQCSIPLASKPGQSNHEGGRAIDTSSYTYWSTVLPSYGWAHSLPTSDPVHFDYSAASNIASMNLKAFQRLANRHANAGLSEDGVYGPATAAALKNAPCNGW